MTLRPSFQQKQTQIRILGGNFSLFFLLLSLLFCSPLEAQHLIGVRGGYNISGIDFQRNDQPKPISTIINFSFLYTYYHPMWEMFPFFGIQTGISYTEQGYSLPGYHPELYDTTRYRVLTVPLVSQFHIDFWKMRLLVNIGAFGGYRMSAKESYYLSENERVSGKYKFDCYDIRPDYGFIGGGGLAFKIDPFELHFECNYSYSLSLLYNPRKLSNSYYIYIYPHQLVFSLGLHYRLSK